MKKALFALCALPANPKITDVLNFGTCTIAKAIVPILFAGAFVVFGWGVAQFILNAQEEAKREKGKQFMIWGIVAITVMFSIWGLVKILGTTFNLHNAAPAIHP